MRLSDNNLPTVSSLVLVVASTEESSRRIERHLRNAGYPIRTGWASDLEEMESFLSGGAPDLVMCSNQMTTPTISEVVELSRKQSFDLPVLALGPDRSAEAAAYALEAGARDLVSDVDADSLRHLEQVCMRELADHAARRDLRNVRARLVDFESRHLQLVAGTVDAVLQTQEGIISHVNQAFAALLGYESATDLIGMPMMDIVHPDHQAKVKDLLKQLSRNRKMDDKALEYRLQNRAGEAVGVSAQWSTGTIDGETFIEMLVRAQTTAQASAGPGRSDAALPDRTAYLHHLEQLPPSLTVGSFALVFLSLDQSLALEDRVGLQDSEQVAIQVAATLRERLDAELGPDSEPVKVFRFSTFEFAALLPSGGSPAFEALPERLRKEFVNKVVATQHHEAGISASIGIYPLIPQEAPMQSLASLVREVRKLSSAGGGRAVLLGPAASADAQSKAEVHQVEKLHKAIRDNRFKLTYQSIASLEGDTRHHFDVLVRMVDEAGEEHYAAEFVRIAEKHGLMKAIDRLVITKALKVLAKREGGAERSMLFLKISEDTLRDADAFIAFIHESLSKRPLEADEVCFEAQELVLQNHIRKGKMLMRALRDAGASIAIEHFGLGSNSIQLLDHIPVTFLKFDKSFTRNFEDRETQRKMSTLMEVAKQRQIKTIVSHVEDANIMARMWQMGVNYIQGFHIQEPEVVMMSADGRL